LLADLDRAAHHGRTRYSICAGAIGGLDLVDAARLSGLTECVYTSRKPPAAWRGTAAEKSLDLDRLERASVFFEGSARDAANAYPQNANVAATLALRGAGLDATRVRLIADPAATRNTHEIRLSSACVDAEFVIRGLPSPDNPKTSMTTGYALAAHVLARLERG
jgi:aspartate dehydrogenase